MVGDMTVKELKEIIKDWPEVDGNGEPTEVWINSGKGLSSIANSAVKLNTRINIETKQEWSDILLK